MISISKMNSNVYCEIAGDDRNSQEEITLAKVDILPGQQIFVETKPLVGYNGADLAALSKCNDILDQYLTAEELKSMKQQQSFCAANMAFLKLSPENRLKVWSLNRPTNTTNQNDYRENSKNWTIVDETTCHVRQPTEAERENYVKVNSVMEFNAFDVDGGKAVYERISKLSRSCQPNCTVLVDGTTVILVCIMPIRKGEELTIEHKDTYRTMSTYQRRRQYLKYQHFTCHCVRCDALGDNTRKFDCCANTLECNGQHLVCHPIEPISASDDPEMAGLPYTGVEYVKPYLLPCSDCGAVPSKQFQKEKFALEKRLPELTKELSAAYEEYKAPARKGKYPSLEATEIVLDATEKAVCHLQPLHVLCAPMLFDMMVMTANLGRPSPFRSVKEHRLQTCRDNIALLESLIVFPCATKRDTYVQTTEYLEMKLMTDDPADILLQAKEYRQTSVRLNLLLTARIAKFRAKDDKFDLGLLAVLERLSGLGLASVELRDRRCAFCEESPDRAAINLSLCGKCRAVQYCNAGCQKAHWKLHKESCVN